MRHLFVTLSTRLIRVLLLCCCLASFLPASAQLCQGSLGDPIVNKTFGSGTNPGAPLEAATTAYQYTSADCPNDGFYTVRNNTNACFGNSWHTLNRDHTGDPNGYFMLVNASIQPSAFYLDTVRGLCGGTTFEFAAWVMNVLLPSSQCNPAIQPNLTFTIERTDGTVLQTYNTNNIPMSASPTWQQFGFFFTTPTNVSDIVLRIFNNSQGGCGNDLALDDITFRPCGPQLNASIVGNTGTVESYCEGTARNFTFDCLVSAGFNNPSYQWQQNTNGAGWTDMPGETNATLSVALPANTPAGVYEYRMAAAEAGNLSSVPCRVVSPVLTVRVNANPVTGTSSNSPVCEKNNLQLNATGGTLYEWTGPGGFAATGSSLVLPNTVPAQSGKYYVLVTNDASCFTLDSVITQINPAPVAVVDFNEIKICQNETVQLVSSGGGDYAWSPATGLSSTSIANPLANPVDTTEYRLIITNGFSCKDTQFVLVNVVASPTVNAGADRTIIKGTSVLLPATATGEPLAYTWTPTLFLDNPSILQPTVTPPADTTYTITVVSTEGCGTATDSVRVFVYKDIYVPSAFSPNNDGLNDTWVIPALAAYPEYEISVFNRQGQLVYYRKNNNLGWDGKYQSMELPVGVYVYMIDVKQGGGFFKGTVSIIR